MMFDGESVAWESISTSSIHGSKLYCVLTQTEAKAMGPVVAARRAALAGEKLSIFRDYVFLFLTCECVTQHKAKWKHGTGDYEPESLTLFN